MRGSKIFFEVFFEVFGSSLGSSSGSSSRSSFRSFLGSSVALRNNGTIPPMHKLEFVSPGSLEIPKRERL